ncbi:MAG: hypothetical protein QMC11_03465 [Rhodospirillales bacterium]|jgi:HAE1 family hydrophobic/amphiphilic exporter-1|tara:strand:+ start:71 stop:304 length:234 start_codon:yes stop_codon:yes gene_type:complete
MIRFFTTHPTIANLLMIGFIVAGFAAVPKLQRKIFTQIEPRRVEIMVAYKGTRDEDIEGSICSALKMRLIASIVFMK